MFNNSRSIKLPDWTLVKCVSQSELILKFGEYLSMIQPDIITGFNDHQYDWQFILAKAKQLNI